MKLVPHVIVAIFAGTLWGAPLWCVAPLAEEPGASAEIGLASDRKREQTFALIFGLAARFSRGELGDDWARGERPDYDTGQIGDELAALRIFLAGDPRTVLRSTIEQSRRCISQGRIHAEVLDSACEGALFSLGFFESAADDDVILSAFVGFLNERLPPDSSAALANAFYPRFNGLVWFAGRSAAAAWTAFIKTANTQFLLYTQEQLDVVLRALNDPPRNLSFRDYSFPPFAAQRRLRSLVGETDS